MPELRKCSSSALLYAASAADFSKDMSAVMASNLSLSVMIRSPKTAGSARRHGLGSDRRAGFDRWPCGATESRGCGNSADDECAAEKLKTAKPFAQEQDRSSRSEHGDASDEERSRPYGEHAAPNR